MGFLVRSEYGFPTFSLLSGPLTDYRVLPETNESRVRSARTTTPRSSNGRPNAFVWLISTEVDGAVFDARTFVVSADEVEADGTL